MGLIRMHPIASSPLGRGKQYTCLSNQPYGRRLVSPLWGHGRAFAFAKVPAGKCPCGSAGRIATGNPPPLQPAVVVASNPATLMHNKKPHTLAGTGLFVVQGWTMGFEPTTTGTTIRGSTAELRPPLVFALACGSNIHGVGTECKPNFVFGLKFVHHQLVRRASTQMADQVSRRS